MIKLSSQKKLGSVFGLIGAFACILINILLFYLANRLSLPLYLDSVGTVLMAILGGSYPGIFTAVITNILCSAFYYDSVFYILIGTLIAIITASYVSSGRYKNQKSVLILVTQLAVVCGVLGTSIQWLLLGEPQFAYISDIAQLVGKDHGILFFFASMLASIILNFIDKGICVGAALLIHHFIPEKTRNILRNLGSKQAKPDPDSKEGANKHYISYKKSLKYRITVVFVAISLTLSLILASVSLNMGFKESMENGEALVSSTAILVSKYIDADSINKYIGDGAIASTYLNAGYVETKNLILSLKKSYNGISRITVRQMHQNAYYTVFDTEPSFLFNGVVGENREYDESLNDIKESLVLGKDVDTQYEALNKRKRITAYVPIFDSKGNCTAYVCAESLINVYSSSFWRLVINMTLAFSGFFVLLVAMALRVLRNNIIYPIESLEIRINGFMDNIDDQEKLDESVKKLQKLDITTGDEIERLYDSICEMAAGTADQMRNIRLLAKENEKMQRGLIITMADMVESRDSDTGAHTLKTAAYVRIILDGLKRKGYYSEKLTDRYMKEVEMSAPLHDVGKINVSDIILNKPGKLTDKEFEKMKTHTTAGRMILENAISSVQGETFLKEAMNMAAYHHERWDGTGYPEGLHGQVIPLSARIMAVADVFDALASPRVYKPAFPLDKALQIIKEGSGSQFDPKCVEVFLDSLAEVKKVLKKYQEE